MNNNIDSNQNVAQEAKLHLVDNAVKGRRKCVEAYNIAPPIRQLIADEFRVIKSSRRLAKKHGLPVHVVQDILHLCLKKEPQSESVRAFLVRQQA